MINNYLKDLESTNLIEEIKNNKINRAPEASVIIVTYNTDQKLLSQNYVRKYNNKGP